MSSDQIILKHHHSVPHANPDTRQFADYIAKHSPQRFLDVGTGSGYIAIRLAKSGAEVFACDVSGQSVALATKNAILNQLAFPVLKSDLFDKVSGVFDAIAFNCPFSMSRDMFPVNILKEWIRKIPPAERYFLNKVPASVLSFRRQLLSRFITESHAHLTPSGSIFLMLLSPEKSWIEDMFDEMNVSYFEDEGLNRRNLLFARLNFQT